MAKRFKAAFSRRPGLQGLWFNTRPGHVEASLDKMLHDACMLGGTQISSKLTRKQDFKQQPGLGMEIFQAGEDSSSKI